MALKYICYRKKVHGFDGARVMEQVVLFSGATAHVHAVPRGIYRGDLISAGFCHLESGRVCIHPDGSESLKLDPRKGNADAELIAQELNSPEVMAGYNAERE